MIYFLYGIIFSIIIYIIYKIEHYKYSFHCKPDEIHFAKTIDGVNIALYRYYNKSQNSNYFPVILCHGYTANRHNMDICKKENGSIAHYLKDEGFDVWIIELRRRGMSDAPPPFSYKLYDWGFADYIEKDIPAAINYVKKHTDVEKVGWLGHSMGGMLGYAGLIKQYPISTVVAVASPANFKYMVFPRWLAKMFRLYIIKPVYFGTTMKMLAPIIAAGRFEAMGFFANTKNYTYKEKLLLINSLFANISRRITADFAEGISNGNFVPSESDLDFVRDIPKIDKPIFFIAGTADVASPTPAVKWAYENVKSKNKQFKEFGLKHGNLLDYGHGDLFISKQAYKEVFPDISEWLKKYNKKTSTKKSTTTRTKKTSTKRKTTQKNKEQ